MTREQLEEREREWLAGYAMKSRDSFGRVHPETEHPYRSIYQRDKDRIIYSTAFRRLEYKTQVFVNHEGDYYRTRLTHTLEVAQIARTLARSLRLNEDLVETIALAHDLGHTPFGHSGEETLSELMGEHGGFDHNTHGLRVVDLLEERYPNFRGLNLTSEVRRGIIRHSTPFDTSRMGCVAVDGPWLLEIQVVDIADQIAYDNHDLDDGIKSGLLNERDMRGIELWEDALGAIAKTFCALGPELERTQMIRYLINEQVSDVLEATRANIAGQGIKTVKDLESNDNRVVDFSSRMNKKRGPLRHVLMEKLYKNHRVVSMSMKAARFLKSLFEVYCENTKQLSPQVQERIEERGKHRAICDYIAGMTDRYALDQYKKIFEPYERV